MTLLASSSKTGELRVVSGHVEGRLWLHYGQLVQSGVGKATGHVDAMFELLRLSDGNFVFRDGVEAAEPQEPTLVEPVVLQAQQRLAEWQQIEAVVPSLEHRVRLVTELPSSEVTLSADDWKLVIAVALAGTVRGVVEELAVDYFEGCRGVKRLVDANLVIVESPRVRSASESARPGRRITTAASAPESPAPDERAERAERSVARQENGFPSLDSLVASVSVTPTRPSTPSPSPSLETLLASAAAAATPEATFRGAGPASAAEGSDDAELAHLKVTSEWPVAKQGEPIRLTRHEDPEESGSELAVVRHLFLSPPASEPAPDFDWQSWNRGAAESQRESEAPATAAASIRPIRPLPVAATGNSPTVNSEPFSALRPPNAASPVSPLVAPAAPAAPLVSPIPRGAGFPGSPGAAGPSMLSPLAAAPSPAPAGAMPAAPGAGAHAGHMANGSSPSTAPTAAGPWAPPAPPAVPSTPEAGAGRNEAGRNEAGRNQKDPETINRGLLLKFLSSVKP